MRENNDDDDDRNFEAISNFISAIKQEKLNPTLLSYEKELVSTIKHLILQQSNNLKDFLKNDDNQELKTANKNFKYMIYNSEIEKIDYLLKTYLKIRLKKIQIYAFHLIKTEHEAQKILSESQMRFLKKYAEMRFQYYKDNVFKYLVKNYRDFKGIEIIFAKSEQQQRERKIYVDTKQSQVELKSPNLNQFVFAQILDNPQQLRFGLDIFASNTNTEQMEVISKGTIIFGPYKNIHDRFSINEYRLV